VSRRKGGIAARLKALGAISGVSGLHPLGNSRPTVIFPNATHSQPEANARARQSTRRAYHVLMDYFRMPVINLLATCAPAEICCLCRSPRRLVLAAFGPRTRWRGRAAWVGGLDEPRRRPKAPLSLFTFSKTEGGVAYCDRETSGRGWSERGHHVREGRQRSFRRRQSDGRRWRKGVAIQADASPTQRKSRTATR
jgi:hypothetical protein